MLPADCSRRLLAELRGALDACAERQRQLERSLRVSRRLLRAWEPVGSPTAEPTLGPDTQKEELSPGTPSPQDLKELELLTQALEKAVRVRKGISKAGAGNKAPLPKSGSIVTPATTAPLQLRAPGRAGSHASETKAPRGICQTKAPAKGHPQHKPLSSGDRTSQERASRTTGPGLGLRDQATAPPAAQPAPEAFTLKEKGNLLQLPAAFRKAASQNSRLWAQMSSTETSDSAGATATAKAQFLQKMQVASGLCGPRLSAAEMEAEVRRLQKACWLLRLRMQEEVAAGQERGGGHGRKRGGPGWLGGQPAPQPTPLPHAAPTDWKQELRCLLTLEGLQAMVGQCLHRLQELQAEQQLGPWPVGLPPRSLSPCGEEDPSWGPRLLLYSSTQELQTLAALRLRVAMLSQQVHLEKVLMAELLPLVSARGPQGLPGLPLCRAVHSLLCDAGERFPTILRDEPTG
ncbi:tubulin epsilon and delta complex protein 2 isoform X2 [Dasypus novemcinctus]|uniref:tubulin epsilon and delta complex protein 2 isoform X2 n=1 Tax=Dasypus novemcinctus TaxID=9361 RepID=UPI00265F1FA7|nr:tubulin epsilon and delta complex protein 2 isoform X1 [Dasypus novemcinctus]